MAISDQKTTTSSSSLENTNGNNSKVWSFLKIPFRGGPPVPGSTASHQHHHQYGGGAAHADRSSPAAANASVSSVARSIFPVRRRLKLDPASKLYFPYEECH